MHKNEVFSPHFCLLCAWPLLDVHIVVVASNSMVSLMAHIQMATRSADAGELGANASADVQTTQLRFFL